MTSLPLCLSVYSQSDLGNSLPGIYYLEMKPLETSPFTVTPNGKESSYPLIGGRLNKLWYIL